MLSNRPALVLTGLALIWGFSFLFMKVMVDAGMGATGVTASRAALGVLTLVPFIAKAKSGLRQTRATWLGLGALGFVNFAFPWTLFAYAEKDVASGVASVGNATTPLWAAIAAAVLLGTDDVRGVRALGLAICFGGVLVLVGGGLADISGDQTTGIGLLLLATLCYGLSVVLIRKYLHHVPPVVLAGGQIGFATLMLVPVAFANGAYSGVDWDAGVVASMVGLGSAGSGIAVLAYMWLIRETGPIRASVVTYLTPPCGVFLGWLLLDEPIGWNMLGGLALILLGVALVQGVPLYRLTGRPAPEPAVPVAVSGE